MSGRAARKASSLCGNRWCVVCNRIRAREAPSWFEIDYVSVGLWRARPRRKGKPKRRTWRKCL